MTAMRPAAFAAAAKGRRAPLFWVPWAFVAAFLVVIVVNGVLIALATRTFSGLVVEKPYLKGLAYEATLRQEAAQAALGWTTTTAYREANREIAVRYLDQAGRAVADLQVVASIASPLRPEATIDVPLHYQGEGWYRAKVEFAHPGQREAAVTAEAGGRRHQLRFRFVVP